MSRPPAWCTRKSAAGIAGEATAIRAAVSTREGLETWLCLANLNQAEARFEIDYYIAGGRSTKVGYILPSGSRTTLLLNQVLGDGRDVSAHVRSDLLILAERPCTSSTAGAAVTASRARGASTTNGVLWKGAPVADSRSGCVSRIPMPKRHESGLISWTEGENALRALTI